MAQTSVMICRTLLAAALAASVTAVGMAVPPPPPILHARPGAAGRNILAWMPGEVRCGAQVEAPVLLRRPYVSLTWPMQRDAVKPASYRFRIDATGRPLSIVRQGAGPVPFSDDIGPALAISTFKPGAERRDCSISYSARITPVAQTPVEDLISYTLAPLSGPLPPEDWTRIRPENATCLDMPRPMPLTQNFPDPDKVAGTAGVRDWSMLRYDLDPQGRPVDVRVAHSTRNAALDAAAIKALKTSRYTHGPRTGCLHPYQRMPMTMAAPPSPPIDGFVPQDARCEGDAVWARQPVLIYPQPYRRHAVEGWAIVAFDVAPWGQTGNVRTLAAEPSDDFGKQAEMMIRSAKAIEGSTGKTGCVQKVRFVIGGPDRPANEEYPEPPPPF